MSKLLLIDNYDSFTFNLAQAFLALGADVRVHRNDCIDVEQATELHPTHLCISPGPGRPEDAGVSMDMIRAFAGLIPVLGVCLGHQSIAAVYGGVVGPAKELMHGKDSPIHHRGDGLYSGLSNPFSAGRYHSLAVPASGVPSNFEVDASTEDGEVMGFRHQTLPIVGIQFHPESILTPEGDRLLQNFLGIEVPTR